MSGLLNGGPLVVLREDRGGPPKIRVDRIRQYLRTRSARSRAYDRWLDQREREWATPAPCVYCGAQTEPWERSGGIAICGRHIQSMSGRFPFRLGYRGADLDRPLEEALYAARKALFVFEHLVRQEEGHGRQAR